MNTPKSKLPQTLFENLDPTPSAHVSSSTSYKRKMMKKKKSILHPNRSTHLARKLINLLQVFKPIPFVPKHALNLSTHEKLLKRAGLWDFLHIKFDPALRSDLIAELIVSYSPRSPTHRRSFVNGLPVNLTRSTVGRALSLPSRRKAGESCGGFEVVSNEVVSDEEVLVLEKVVLNWVVLGGLNDDVLDVLRFVKEKGRPERVDWASLVWVMVERELVKGVELVECYYASHLQCFLRKQRPNLFAEQVGKLGFDDLGVDERENEKNGKSLVGYQRRKGKSGQMVDREGQKLSGSSFGHGEDENEGSLEVVSFGEKGGGDVVGGERRGVNDDGVEEVVDERLTGLENDQDELSLMQDGNVNELEGECFMKEGGELGSENIGLINEVGKEDDCKQDVSFVCATEIEKEKSGLLVQHGEEDNEADEKRSEADDDSGKQLENELLDLIAEQGKDDQLKLDILVKEDEGMIGVNISSSGDSYAMEQGSEAVGREGQKLSTSSFRHGEDEIKERLEVVNFGEKGGGDVGGERSGVNVNDDGGEEVVDARLMGFENDEDGLSLMQDGNVNELEGGCFMKEGEDTGGEMGSENIGLIDEEGTEDDRKQDVSLVDATEIEKEKRGLMVQHGEEDNETDVNMSVADDQLKLDISVKEDEGMIGVNISSSGDLYAMEQGSETVGYCSLQGELELKAKQLEYEQTDMIQGKSHNEDREIGLDLGLKESDKLVLAASVKEVEDGSIDFSLLQSEMKMEGLLKEGEDVELSSADDDNGKELEIRVVNLISEHEKSVMENQEKGLGLRRGEKGEVLVQADFAKQDGAAIDVEVSSSGNSSGNHFEPNQMHSCARQSICRSDFVEVVREDDTVDFEDSKEQVLFQQCSPGMDAGFDSQSEKAAEVIEVDNIDFEEREEKDKEWLFQHCSLSTDAGSQSEKAVEVSEDDYFDSARNLHCSPSSKVNGSSFVEPSVTGTGTKMEIASSDFFGNALKRKKAYENDVFMEPFVLEQNINADMSGASVFENSLKTEIDLLNDGGHKRLRTEGQSDEEPMTNIDMSGVSMFPLKRKMDHTTNGHGRMRSEGLSNEDLMDFNSWEEKVDFWLAEAKMVYAAREEAWISAQLKEQNLVKKLEELDSTIHIYEKTKHEEIQKRNSKINCLENELFFMANQIDHYKKALQATRKTFAAYKERCGLPEEPLYRDIPGSGGIVLSTTEWEKEQLRRREHGDLLIELMIKDFHRQWSDKFKGHAKKIMSLDNRLSYVEKEAKDLQTFSKKGFWESEK